MQKRLRLRQTAVKLSNQTRLAEIWLTMPGNQGLIRPVARIAQSVEQGIENPRVLGSIPSPGTTKFRRTQPMAGFFAFGEPGSSSNAVRDYSSHPCDSPRGPAQALFKNAPGVFVRVRTPLNSEEPAYGGFFASGEPDSSSNCVRLLVVSLRLALRASASAVQKRSRRFCPSPGTPI